MASARCALGRISPKSRPKIRPNQLKIGLNWYKSYVIKVFVMALRDPCFQTERNQLYPEIGPKYGQISTNQIYLEAFVMVLQDPCFKQNGIHSTENRPKSAKIGVNHMYLKHFW